MTDRELLEFAAKAAEITGYRYSSSFGCMAHWNESDGGWFDAAGLWDPLTNDGDALRLAVRLGLVVFVMNNPWFTGVYLPYCQATGKYDEVQMHKNDPAYATRRAITMAAAKIGGAMS